MSPSGYAMGSVVTAVPHQLERVGAALDARSAGCAKAEAAQSLTCSS